MKKLFVIVLVLVMFGGVVLAEKSTSTELSPMFLVELQADMKADLILAERHMTLEIRDELETQSKVVVGESLEIETTAVIEREVAFTDWPVSAQD